MPGLKLIIVTWRSSMTTGRLNCVRQLVIVGSRRGKHRGSLGLTKLALECSCLAYLQHAKGHGQVSTPKQTNKQTDEYAKLEEQTGRRSQFFCSCFSMETPSK